MCAVTAAPAAAGVRVCEVMSRGRGPRVGCPPPEGVDVAYPHVVASIAAFAGGVWFSRWYPAVVQRRAMAAAGAA